MYKKIDEKVIKRLKEILGQNLILDPENMHGYTGDEFADPTIRKRPEVVVKPKNEKEIAQILKLANEERIPVTPRGGGTGLCGGCIPLYEGIVLSLENMHKILEIDRNNMLAFLEAGVTLKDLYQGIENEGLFFPPHPGDEGAQFGGLVSTNASGARAVKYGGIRNYVIGLEVVFPNGAIVTMGGKYIKSSTGYSLINLMIGSEGTLGVITKVLIKLLPKAPIIITLIVPYDNLEDALVTVLEVHNQFLPMAIEFIEDDVIPPTESLLNKKWPCRANVYLLIIIDSTHEDEALRTCEAIADICLKHNVRSTGEIVIADTKERQKNVLDIRSSIYLALKPRMIEILDIAVPPAMILKYMEQVREIAKKYNIWLPTYGHAADGNVHTHIMKIGIKKGKLEEKENDDWNEKYLGVREELHEIARKLGGVVSGEHGIGLVKKKYLPLFLDPVQIELMKQIKKLFDPQNILNPGKIFDI